MDSSAYAPLVAWSRARRSRRPVVALENVAPREDGSGAGLDGAAGEFKELARVGRWEVERAAGERLRRVCC